MAVVVVTLRIMPVSVDINLDTIEEQANALIRDFGGEPGKKVINPIAFGLNALDIYFTMPEEKGSTDALEIKVREVEGVQSAEVTDVRRTMG
ncbi:MAG: elongation factor 1-beta [Nanoarchaeota archaeon]|nr:elongation factor 1-beta [Nanoarchaeota archaeon]MBU1704108.1 elongation factor 1-beta [Nanoarchaeota archaeon]